MNPITPAQGYHAQRNVSQSTKPFVEKRARRWCFLDLVTDSYNGKLKETLLWSNLGKASALVWFSWKCYHDTDSPELWLIVMVVLTAHAMFSQFLSAKLGIGPTTTTTTATAEVTTTTKAKK